MPTLSMNTDVFAVTQYDNFKFSDMFEFRGNVICSGSSKTFAFGDDDDDDGLTILAEIKLPTHDFGSDNLKHIRSMIFGAELADDLSVSIETDENEIHPYLVKCGNKSMKQHNHKLPVGRKCDGRYFTITIKNPEGGDFSINSISAVTIDRHSGSSF